MPGLWDGSDYATEQFHDAAQLHADARAHAQATGEFDAPPTLRDFSVLTWRDWQRAGGEQR